MKKDLFRYNTDEANFEVDSFVWNPHSPENLYNYKSNLGDGDGTETTFGPLNSGDAFYPVPIAEANVLVFVENVFQLPVSNYSLVQNPSSGPNTPYAAGWYIVFGTPVPSGKPVNVLHNFDK